MVRNEGSGKVICIHAVVEDLMACSSPVQSTRRTVSSRGLGASIYPQVKVLSPSRLFRTFSSFFSPLRIVS